MSVVSMAAKGVDIYCMKGSKSIVWSTERYLGASYIMCKITTTEIVEKWSA